MKFRKIYWVTEQIGTDGRSQVAGVFTSIQDLVGRGILWMDGIDKQAGFRLSLVQLDSNKPPLGSWVTPDFSGLEQDLQEFVESDEIGTQNVEQLALDLRAFF